MSASASLSQEFYTKFQASRTHLVNSLDRVELAITPDVNDVNGAVAACTKLRREMNDAATEGFLPAYDLRSLENQLKDIEKRISALQSKSGSTGTGGQKKGRFAFKKGTPTSTGPPPPGPPTTSSFNEAAASTSPDAMKKVDTESATPHDRSYSSAHANNSSLVLNDQSLEYISRSTLLEQRTGAQHESKVDLTLSRLNRCAVDFVTASASRSTLLETQEEGADSVSGLRDGDDACLTAVRAEHIKESVLFLGRVQGSVILHGLEGCLVVVECHQLRIHTSRNSRFLLRVGSDAIIEHCEGLEIGSWPGSSSDSAGVTPVAPSGESVRAHNVKPLTVKDFSHLRSGPSPNWRMMDEEEVKGLIESCWNVFSAAGRTDVEVKDVDVGLVLGALLKGSTGRPFGTG